MFESAFDSCYFDHLKETILRANLLSRNDFTVLSLVSKCTAIKVGNYVLGSKKSRHNTSSVHSVSHWGVQCCSSRSTIFLSAMYV